MHQYFCPNGHSFERFEGIHEDKPKKCPECGARAKIGCGMTGAPILKEGTGGFYKPTPPERNPNA